jgi:myosin-1
MLEESRERKYDTYARVLQKAFRRFTAVKRHAKQKEEACQLVYGKKQRRRHSINRNFVGDYIGLDNRPALQAIVGRRERIDFAHSMNKIDRRLKTSKVDVLVTSKYIYIIGRVLEKKGVNKGKLMEVVKREIAYEDIQTIGLSTLQDDYIFIQVKDDYTSLLESPLKTEMLTIMK